MAAVVQKQLAQDAVATDDIISFQPDGVSEFAKSFVGDAIGDINSDDFNPGWQEQGPLTRNTPDPRPGYVQEWKRMYFADSTPDKKNMTRVYEELGWRARVFDDSDSPAYSVSTGGGKSVRIVSGMILMERKVEVDEKVRAVKRKRIEMQSAGANLDENGLFDDRLGRMFGSVKSISRTGRDAADLIDN
jgi:hypothetical protein